MWPNDITAIPFGNVNGSSLDWVNLVYDLGLGFSCQSWKIVDMPNMYLINLTEFLPMCSKYVMQIVGSLDGCLCLTYTSSIAANIIESCGIGFRSLEVL